MSLGKGNRLADQGIITIHSIFIRLIKTRAQELLSAARAF